MKGNREGASRDGEGKSQKPWEGVINAAECFRDLKNTISCGGREVTSDLGESILIAVRSQTEGVEE